MAKEIFMGTTQIPASKTIGQISETLRRYGVSGVTQRYGPDGLVESVEFSVSRNGQEFAFMLPARVDAVFRTITTAANPISVASMPSAIGSRRSGLRGDRS
jgi:hypothetical protein